VSAMFVLESKSVKRFIDDKDVIDIIVSLGQNLCMADEFRPMALLVNETKGLFFWDTHKGFLDETSKNCLLEVLRMAAKSIRATRYLFITESWMVVSPKPVPNPYDTHNTIKDMPGRLEALTMIHESCTEHRLDMWEILRAGTGKDVTITLNPLMVGEKQPTATASRFAGIILPDYDNPPKGN